MTFSPGQIYERPWNGSWIILLYASKDHYTWYAIDVDEGVLLQHSEMFLQHNMVMVT